MAGLQGWHLVILLVVFVVIFGARKLPDAARALGQSARILKAEVRGTSGHSGQDERQPAERPTLGQPPITEPARDADTRKSPDGP